MNGQYSPYIEDNRYKMDDKIGGRIDGPSLNLTARAVSRMRVVRVDDQFTVYHNEDVMTSMACAVLPQCPFDSIGLTAYDKSGDPLGAEVIDVTLY